MKKILFTIICYFFILFNYLYTKEINDIRSWKHPTKEIFLSQNIELEKIIIDDKNFPVFYISKLPKDFNVSNYIFLSLLAEKNGFWDFGIKTQNNYLKVFCNKKKKRVIKIEMGNISKQFDNYSYNEAEIVAKKLIIEKENLTYMEKEKCFYNKNDGTYVILKTIGFDEYGRFEIRISPVDYPLSVYNYFYVDLLLNKIYEE